MTANRHTFPRSSLALSLALACGSILLSVSTARGAPTPAHWLGGSGDWSDPAHWDIGVVPNNTGPSTYGVTIEGPAEDLVVTVSKGITVSRIVSTERIQVAGGGTLAVLGILVNAGEIVAAGGTVRLDNTTADNAGGTIVADGGVVEVVNSTINGGVLRATDKATSLVRFSGDVTLNGVPWVDDGAGEFQIINTKARMLGDYAHRLPAGYRLVLISTYGHFATAQWTVAEGEFVNHGVIELRDGGWGWDPWLVWEGSGTLAGAGEVWLSGSGDWCGIGGAAGAELTIGASQRVHGRGEIAMPVVNQGTLEADVGGKELRVTGLVQNTGLARCVGSGHLALVGGLTDTGTLTIGGGGRVTLKGAVSTVKDWAAVEGSVLRLESATASLNGRRVSAEGGVVDVVSSTVSGGSVRVSDAGSSAVRFSGDVTLNGVPWVDDGAGEFQIINTAARFFGDYAHRLPAGYRLVVISTYGHFATAQWTVAEGEFVNDGVIELRDGGWGWDPWLVWEGSGTLAGAGEVWLSESGDWCGIGGAAGAELTIGPSQRVHGRGEIAMPVVNQGTLEADVNGRELRATSRVNNAGTLGASNGGTLTVLGALTNSGTIRTQEQPGSGSLAFRGGVVNQGTIALGSGAGGWVLSGAVDLGTDLVATAGRAVNLVNATVRNAGHEITAAGGVVGLEGSTLNGGTLRVSDAGSSAVRFSGDVTVNGVPWVDDGAGEFQIINTAARFFGDYAHRLPAGYRLVVISTCGHFATAQWTVAEGEFVNDGVIELRDGGWGWDPWLVWEGSGTLTGAGEVWLSGSGDWCGIGGAAGAELTIGPGQRVHGRGEIAMPVVNQGTLEADINGRELRVTGPAENEGRIGAGNGGVLSIAGQVKNLGTLETLGGSIRLSGSLHVDGTGVMRGQSAGTLSVRGHLLGDTSNASAYTPQLQLVFDGAGALIAFVPGALVIEAEDFDFGSGQHKPEADAMRYVGGAYQGLGGIDGIDFHQTANVTASDVYRSGEGPNVNVNIAANGDTLRGDYTLTTNYKVGWNDASEWYDYTRVFPSPARDYHVFARLSSGGAPNAIQFDEVTDGAGTPNQTLKKIGEARGPASGGWDTFVHVPVKDDSGALATVNFAGEKTIRVTILPDSNEDLNYFTFAPAELSGTAQLFEAMGRDLGPVPAGFDDNLAYATVALGNNSSVRLVDFSANTGDGKAEAVYVTTLSVPASATLDLNGLHLYARAVQIAGTVLGGSVEQVPDGGGLEWGLATPGAIGAAGELDEWTFYGRAGQFITVVVNPGGGGPSAPVSPALRWVQVRVLDATGKVLGESNSTQSGAVLTLADVARLSAGDYRVQVRAAPGHEASTGNYTTTLWDVTPEETPLVFGQRFVGRLATPFSVDRWTFAAMAGQQVRFRLVKVSGASPVFTLTGPEGWVGFDKLTADSELVSLPTAGSYVLTASSAGGQYGGSYAFQLDETAQTELTLGTPHVGNFVSKGQPQLFRLALSESTPLRVVLDNDSTQNRAELYLKRGSPPTRGDYDYRAAEAASSARQILVPMATPGTWYILVYAGYVHTHANYTLLATAAPMLLIAVTPDRQAAHVETKLTLTGAGFDATTGVQFVAPAGQSFSASRVELDSFTQLTASFAAGAVPAGRYAVRVARTDESSAELPDAFEMVAEGKPRLRTRVIIPAQVGYHQLATIYIEYANVGDVTVPAPLLALTPKQNGRAAALLTLDHSRVTQGFWTTAIPEGFANTVQILASGKVPGSLQPGESGRVPVYWAGWQQPWDMRYPPIQFELARRTTTDQEPMDWPALKAELRPDWISAEAWEAVFANLTQQIGATWGACVAMLNENAAYLGRLGQTVTDVDQLWGFELRQAVGLSPLGTLAQSVDLLVPGPGLSIGFNRVYRESIEQRFVRGPFGRGWTTAWLIRLRAQPDGAVEIVGPDASVRRFEPDSRTGGYFAPPGEGGSLRRAPGAGYVLQEADGLSLRFFADGKLDYLEDNNGNRISVSYTSDRLSKLDHSAGPSLSVFYNATGLVESITDSLGRSASYTYDQANEHLITVRDYRGRTTQYAYSEGTSLGSAHALLSVAYPDGTHDDYAYDTAGRLVRAARDADAERIEFAYDPTGMVTLTDANGSRSRLFYDVQGSVAAVQAACCASAAYAFDDLHRLSRLTDANGHSESFTYRPDGALVQQADAAGQAERFTYLGPPRRLESVIDARGNTTRFTFDSRWNPIALRHPDGSRKSLVYDAQGNLLSLLNRRGELLTFGYNAAGALTRQTLPSGGVTDFTYDLRGNLLTISNTQGTLRLEYDAVDQITNVTYPNGRFLTYTYDDAGRRIRMEDHLGFAVNYAYDAVGRLATLTDGSGARLVAYRYDAAGRLLRKDHGNGTYTSYTHDDTDRVLHLVNHAPDGSVNSRFDYSYDTSGRVATLSTLDGQWRYHYDPSDQLTRALFTSGNPEVPSQDLAYAYDPVGNRIRVIQNGVTTNYEANNLNQYSAVGDVACAYDAEGNLVAQTGGTRNVRFTYDHQNRLTRVIAAEGTWDYEYDALGYRAVVLHDGQRTEYLIDPLGLGTVVGEFDGNGGVFARYAHGLALVSRIDAAGRAGYYDFDAQGSTAGLTDGSGTQVNRYAYEPFGQKLASVEAIPNPYTFVGELGVADDSNGLSFMRARYYAPRLGRFCTEDPIGMTGGDLNLYRYARNSPPNRSDPSGFKAAAETECDTKRRKATIHYYGNSKQDPCVVWHEEAHARWCTSGRWPKWRDQCNKMEAEGYGLSALCAVLKKPGDYQFYKDQLDLAKKGKHPDCYRWPKRPKKTPRAKCEQATTSKASLQPASPIEWPPTGDGDGDGDDGEDADGDGFPDGPAGSCPGGPAGTAGPTDPNRKIGPPGFGPAGYVSPGRLLPYRIDFENDPAATAPAQFVVVADQLDANLDWSTFELTEVGFGDQFIVVPDGRQHFETVVPMSYNGRSFEVHVNAGLDLATGKLTARFMSIDPATELPPDVLTGFLPPEDGTGRGQGHISYVVRLKAGVASGAEIRNVAHIQFDFGETIGTNQRDAHDPSKGTDPTLEALITIDAAPPSSQVLPLPATTAPGDFTVNWTGADDPGGSGLARFDIYFADDRGPWTLWKTGVTETSATFTGQLGHRYAFYSIATDNVGHREAPPESADASTFVAVMPAPDLEITLTAQTIELSWPSAASDFQLEQTDALAPTPTWQRVEKQPVVSGERCTVRLAVTNSTMFYRLRKP